MPRTSYLFALGLMMFAPALAPSRESDETIPLPIENGKVNVSKLEEMRYTRKNEILKRIREIHAVVEKAFADQAPKLFGISKEEYIFLSRQAQVQSETLSKFFEVGRSRGLNTIEEASLYFDNAFQALQAGEYWFGREESLVEKDRSLHSSMDQAIAVELAKTEEGMKILDLRKEKQQLLSELKDQQPIYEYLLERRRWWRYYPDYEKLTNRLHESQLEEIAR